MKCSSIPFYLFLLACLFLALGCEDDNDVITPEPEEESTFLTALPGRSGFDFQALGIQLYADNMLIQTQITDFQFLSNSSMPNRLESRGRSGADATSTTLHARIIDETVNLEFIGIPPLDNGPRFRFPVTEFGDDARLVLRLLNQLSPLAALSEDDYLLLPFRREGDSRLWLGILEITYEGAPSIFNAPALASVQTIVLPSFSNRNATIYHQEILPVSGGFLVTLRTFNNEGPTYRVDYDGTFEIVFDGGLDQMFHYGGELLAVRHNVLGLEILTADTNGRNWTVKHQIPIEENDTYRFFPTAEDLYVQARTSGQLFITTQFTTDGFEIEALDTPTLDTRNITVLDNYNGDTYIGTRTGIFFGATEQLRSSRRQ